MHCQINSQSINKPHLGPPPRREVERTVWNGAERCGTERNGVERSGTVWNGAERTAALRVA
eukprot:364955-Chlamydomonas_euryale.AAC.23